MRQLTWKKADQLKSTLIQYAYDEENGCFYDSLDGNMNPTKHSSMHATAYALNYGVYTDQDMADRMAKFVYGKCEEQFTGSVYVTYFILNGLYQSGNGDLAERLLTNPKTGDGVKTYANLLDNLNCTITPEAWGPTYKSNMTFSHPWGAAPGCAIVQGCSAFCPQMQVLIHLPLRFSRGSCFRRGKDTYGKGKRARLL